MTTKSLETLRKRSDFLRLNRGRKHATHGLVLQVMPTPDAHEGTNMIRLGLTITKKIGNAVIRNRVRRRLREAARAVLPVAAQPGHDYVLIARQGALGRSSDDLKGDLMRALKAVHRPQTAQKQGKDHETA
jgi:ribonuclease P protein component